jgi:hypothetical protein
LEIRDALTIFESLKEVAVFASNNVLVEADNDSLLLVGNPKGNFRPGAQTSPNPLIKCYYYINNLSNYMFLNFIVKLTTVLREGGNRNLLDLLLKLTLASFSNKVNTDQSLT